ncbi:MAG: glycogen synthase GlgA [Opitutae bacterium]|nr:glycogen synthase GlgA [Opitutae bacterium]
MKIVHVASELFPYVKTGGLADAVGSLATTLAGRGHEVAVFLPGYRAVLEHPEATKAERRLRLRIEMGDRYFTGEVWAFSPRKNLTIYLICRDELFDRRGLYGNGERDYEDNFHRFLYFQKGVIEALRLLGLNADVVHCHDWQTGLLPLLLRYTERRQGMTLAVTTVFTIHNIAFQGLFPMRSYHRTNLPDEFKGIEGVEFYGQLSMMKGGLIYADRITTVSPHYAQEIQTPLFGCGLEGVVASRAEDLSGLINGIDTDVWNPAKDRLIPARYSVTDLSGKAKCRAELLSVMKLAATDDTPIYGMVCRLAEQKGIDLLLANQDFFLRENVRLLVLGSGEKRYENALQSLVTAAPDKIALATRLDEKMSHWIEAGSDFFVMPSLFEPCGLNQMYSQAYGTVPLTSRVGGLSDTVIDADQAPAAGTGLTYPATAAGLRDALQRSQKLFADRARYAEVQRRGMERDFSWATAAQGYQRLYEGSL